MKTYDLKGRHAIVTGASRGIGAAIAAELARCGADVALTARDAGLLETLRATIAETTGTRPVAFACDLREPPAAAKVVKSAAEAMGGIDILVNNAGATKRGDFLQLADEDFLDGFALKFHGGVRMTRAAWPYLKSAKGVIVNIVGVGSNTPSADFTIGGPVNSAIINFSKAIADRGLADGIRVNAINPGFIITDRLRGHVDALAKRESLTQAEAEERFRVAAAVQRFGKPEEVAGLTAFLCSSDSSYIHGAKIDIDGGITRGI